MTEKVQNLAEVDSAPAPGLTAAYASQKGSYSVVGNTIRGAGSGIQITGFNAPPENSNPAIPDDSNSAVDNQPLRWPSDFPGKHNQCSKEQYSAAITASVWWGS